MLSVTVRVHGEHRSPLRIHGGYAAPTPTGFAQIVTDDFPFTRVGSASRRNNFPSDQQLTRENFRDRSASNAFEVGHPRVIVI